MRVRPWHLMSGFACVATLLALSGCSKPVEPQEKAEVVMPVLATKVALVQRAPEYTYSGEVRARHETVKAFRVGGKIIDRYVEVGSLVKPKQALARIDASDYELSSHGVQSQIQGVRADYEQARKELERFATLLDKKFISQAEFDRRQNVVNLAKSRLDELQSRLGVTSNQVGYTVLRSDETGVITAIEAERGQVVTAGQPVLRLAQMGEIDVVVNVPENQLQAIQQAQAVQVSVWANPGKIYAGKVREVSPIADPVTRTYTAKIALTQANDEVRLGMTATVKFRGEQNTAAYIPLSAIYRKNNQTAVWVVDARTHEVALVPVVAKAFSANEVAIEGGLHGGETIVTAGVHKLFSGQKVRVLENSAP
jgi:multidrug efflux system membrane fusion protein